MSKSIEFSSKSGKKSAGALAEPSGSGKAGAIVLLQEWWGVNDHIRTWADRLAAEGFVVLAPDLYHGKTTKDRGEASKLMTELDTLQAVDEIAGAVSFLSKHDRSNGKVAVLGFCMGGALTLASACHVSGLSAAVPFYGIPPAEKVDYAKVGVPVLMHVAKHDEWVTVPKAEEVQKKIGDKMQLCVYDAQHAFMNDTRPEVYDAGCAKQALERTLSFLKQHLS